MKSYEDDLHDDTFSLQFPSKYNGDFFKNLI